MEKTLPFAFRRFDFAVLIISLIIILIGISTIQSTVIANTGSDIVLQERLLNVQIIAVLLGILVLVIASLFNYRYLQYFWVVMYIFSCSLQLLVIIFGDVTRGATSWFQLGPVNFQPSSLTALVMIISCAAFLIKVKEKINSWLNFIIYGVMVSIPTILLLLEPDLGSAIVVFMIWFGLMHFSAIKFRKIAIVYLLLIIMLPLSWGYLADYQKLRLTSFLDPEANPSGAGYNLIQSIIAVGSGQLSGRGWGRGTQSHLQYLPEQHTDFIFATYAEEQGFIGVLVLVVLYGALILRFALVANGLTEPFAKMVVLGLTIWLCVHIFINIGMNLGIAPITGIPLPLMSYGGTAIITVLTAFGIYQSIYRYQER